MAILFLISHLNQLTEVIVLFLYIISTTLIAVKHALHDSNISLNQKSTTNIITAISPVVSCGYGRSQILFYRSAIKSQIKKIEKSLCITSIRCKNLKKFLMLNHFHSLKTHGHITPTYPKRIPAREYRRTNIIQHDWISTTAISERTSFPTPTILLHLCSASHFAHSY